MEVIQFFAQFQLNMDGLMSLYVKLKVSGAA